MATQPPNSASTSPEAKSRFGKRLIKLIFLFGFGFVFVAMCFSAWIFSPPAVREVKLDLKNGNTLSMKIPIEWKIDEKATSVFNSNFDISNPGLKNKRFYLDFKRIELTGIRKWIETALYGTLEPFEKCEIQVECESHPLIGAYSPEAKRNQDMMQFQSIFDGIERNNKNATFPSTTTVFSKSDDVMIGYGYETLMEPKVKGKQKFGRSTIKLNTMGETSIYSVTPDKKQTVSIKLIAEYPDEGEKVTTSAKRLLASSLKFVPTNPASK